MQFLLYGANGYTGELIAREAVRRGLRPILAGRNSDAVGALARELDLEWRAFSLDDPGSRIKALDGIGAVLHCAGPFSRTSEPMVRACLAAGAHYLDITGEITVFESIFARDDEAKRAGVALIPGVGFDVVPTDCLAAMLGDALPDSTELVLAFYARGTTVSRGTLATMIEGLGEGGAIRRDGRIIRVPPAWDVREIPFSCGPRMAMTIPWGDVSTAFRTTGIPNIRVYTAAPPKAIRRVRRAAMLMPLLRIGFVKRILQRLARGKQGPDAARREAAAMYLWGSAGNGKRTITATLQTPEGYAFTVQSALAAVTHVVEGRVAPGAWTPSRAFGKEFVREIAGVLVSS